ncbi:MAG: DUF1501 domain-containing protein [Planctomycetes bacterium]|nr:DUF1501 domain-containing protein [Planctomycetota bacterium]
MNKQHFNPSRRRFLSGAVTIAGAAGVSSLGLMGSTLLAPKAVSAAPLPNHKRVVVLNLRGGNDGLNTVIPTARTAYYDVRSSIAIAGASALPLFGSTTYRLHPSLTRVAALANEGALAVVNQVGYPNRNLSHFLSEDIWSFGIRGNFSGNGVKTSGWMARFADFYAPTPTGIVAVRSGRPTDFFGGTTSPLMVGSLSGFNFHTDWGHRYDHAYRQTVVQEVASAGVWEGDGLGASATAIAQSYDLAGEIKTAIDNYSSTVEYANQNPSHAFLDIARLIQAGFDTKIFYVGYGGFDTHSDQPSRHANLLGAVDNALGAFADDLKAMGAWQDTLVVVISEFGRRHDQNGSNGTDHGHGNCMMLLGGAVNGGVYGPDHTNADIEERMGTYRIDFRTVYRQVLADHLGVDPDPVFTEAAEISDSPGGLIA